jgi:hypothetical protein
MDIVELFIDENDEVSGIEAISVVENPAIEADFIALKNHILKFAEVDQEKRILMGPALIPNKPIFRKSGDNEYYIYFSRNTVRKASELFFKKGHQSQATLEHESPIKGMTVVESWIVESEKDKSRHYDMDVPVGTWMVSMRVDNDEIWEDYVKTGRVKGFSIEAYFTDKLERPQDKSIVDELSQIEDEEKQYILSMIRGIVKKDRRKKSGETIEMESFSDYPDSVVNNAKRGIELNKKNGNKCATQVGKIRARQLSQKQPISEQTLVRMYSYLSRAEEYYDESDSNACGTISFLLWGGKSGLRYAEKKMREMDRLAEIGPRGGVKKSPKAPKSATPNKNPKGEGTAKGDASTSRGAKVSAKDEATLKQKSDDFNKRYKDKLGYGVTVGMLKSVFQRGLGAFNTSHSPRVTNPSQWAFARVNAYLYMVRNGRPQNPKYTGDFDLLPKKHPKSNKK